MHILGYIAAAFIGISLSIVGGGGSILTIPVMVYLFSIQPVPATSYALFVVGSASLVGACDHYRKGLVSLKAALLLGVSSVATVFITRKFIIPFVPETETIGQFGGYTITVSFVFMILLAILMLMASVSMIRGHEEKTVINTTEINMRKLPLYGIALGLLTGIMGIGGGFLLIPVLVLLVGLPAKQAVGTSLCIIALNSFIGFTGDIGHFIIDWPLLVKITVLAVAGTFAGSIISKKIKGEQLKKTFGWLLLTLTGYIFVREIFIR